MRQRIAMILAVVACAAVAGSVRADDQEKFQGIWRPEKHVRGGKEAPAEELEKMSVEFKGNKVAPKRGDREEKPAEFKLDGSKSPKAIDITPPEGGAEQEVLKGIYEISGDTLKLCFSREGERPTKFESPEGSKTMLIVLKRVKK